MNSWSAALSESTGTATVRPSVRLRVTFPSVTPINSASTVFDPSAEVQVRVAASRDGTKSSATKRATSSDRFMTE
jgi:hypothetical protein